jgi:NAD(P)-dependent dehydrogenase (short-subunit alcohol dehydrogenase family)
VSKWSIADIPDQTGRTAVVTGSNTGLGYETAAALAAKGAHVVLAVRNVDKGAPSTTPSTC